MYYSLQKKFAISDRLAKKRIKTKIRQIRICKTNPTTSKI